MFPGRIWHRVQRFGHDSPLFLLNSLQIGIGVVQDIGLRRNLWALGDRGHQQMGVGLQDIQDLGYGGEDAHATGRLHCL